MLLVKTRETGEKSIQDRNRPDFSEQNPALPSPFARLRVSFLITR
jgi:hypothetical protein